MKRLLLARLSSTVFDRWFSWTVGFFLLGLVTTLVLKALTWLDLGRSLVLVLSVAVGWLVLGCLFPGRGKEPQLPITQD